MGVSFAEQTVVVNSSTISRETRKTCTASCRDGVKGGAATEHSIGNQQLSQHGDEKASESVNQKQQNVWGENSSYLMTRTSKASWLLLRSDCSVVMSPPSGSGPRFLKIAGSPTLRPDPPYPMPGPRWQGCGSARRRCRPRGDECVCRSGVCGGRLQTLKVEVYFQMFLLCKH